MEQFFGDDIATNLAVCEKAGRHRLGIVLGQKGLRMRGKRRITQSQLHQRSEIKFSTLPTPGQRRSAACAVRAVAAGPVGTLLQVPLPVTAAARSHILPVPGAAATPWQQQGRCRCCQPALRAMCDPSTTLAAAPAREERMMWTWTWNWLQHLFPLLPLLLLQLRDGWPWRFEQANNNNNFQSSSPSKCTEPPGRRQSGGCGSQRRHTDTCTRTSFATTELRNAHGNQKNCFPPFFKV